MSGKQPIGNRFNMKLEMLEIERFYDQRAPSDEHRGQRVESDHGFSHTVSMITMQLIGLFLVTQ